MNQKSKIADTLPDYNITVQGRHLQVSDAMKDYVLEKLSKLDRFSIRIIDINVTMDIQKMDHRVDIVMKFNHFKIKVHADSDNMYASIDKATEKLQNQLIKYKKKIQDHQAKSAAVVEMKVNVLQRKFEEDFDNEFEDNIRGDRRYHPHEIVRTETRALKILTQDEAVMKMELSGDRFLVFRAEEDRKIKVIYRMSDDNYGIIEVE